MINTFEETITRVLQIIKRSNMITMMDLDDRVRLGMYYLMKIYGLGFRQRCWGTWEWVELSNGGDTGLTADEILEMTPDMDIYNQLRADHNAGIFPEGFKKSADTEKPKKTSQEFGWLSPTGNFTESDWGHHLGSAIEIIKKNNWQDEFDKWNETRTCMAPENDFLCEVKGYVLIHNPSMDGGYIVTNIKPLTKKQREFLYDYFREIGNHGRAEMYLRGDN